MKVKFFTSLLFMLSLFLYGDGSDEVNSFCFNDDVYSASTSGKELEFCKNFPLNTEEMGVIIESLDIEAINASSLQSFINARRELSCYVNKSDFNTIIPKIKRKLTQWKGSPTSCKDYLSTQLLCLVPHRQEFKDYQLMKTWEDHHIASCWLGAESTSSIVETLYPKGYVPPNQRRQSLSPVPTVLGQ